MNPDFVYRSGLRLKLALETGFSFDVARSIYELICALPGHNAVPSLVVWGDWCRLIWTRGAGAILDVARIEEGRGPGLDTWVVNEYRSRGKLLSLESPTITEEMAEIISMALRVDNNWSWTGL